ncbi:MAG TPA: enediyne biosynthesis protein UnbU [Actinocrinis sp.]|nr:enediyne biosynthesis protein UnbU [Actinocrinis sp.]
MTVLGHTVLGFEQSYAAPILAVLVAYTAEFTFESTEAWASRRRPRYLGSVGRLLDFFLPAHISGLACAMLLYAGARLMPVVSAAVLATASKYVVRLPVGGRLRHVLNPSNTGIVMVLLLFPWAGVAAQYQFTEWVPGWWRAVVPLVVLVAGTLLNAKLTRKTPLIMAWLAGFALQAAVRAVLTDVALPSALLVMTGAAFVLFTNYMITDPGTTPVRPRNQVVYGLAAAVVYGLLVGLHLGFALFFALAIVGVGRGLILAALALRSVLSAGTAATARPVLVPVGSSAAGPTSDGGQGIMR